MESERGRYRRCRNGGLLGAACAAACVVPLAACDGPLSTLIPAGRDAERIAALWWWMAGGAAVVWMGVIALTIYAIRSSAQQPERVLSFLVIGGGTIVPTVLLSMLLIHGLGMMPELLDPGPDDQIEIRVTGEQWWWRVTYRLPDGTAFELANELRLPLGRRVPVKLEAADVIHSLWVPGLGGKVDMIPGRVNRMALEPVRPGVYWGACAEYCGLSHAKMLLRAVVLEQPRFDTWARAQARPAAAPATARARDGARLFTELGCDACHTIRGTGAKGRIGPDLTHVGGRVSLAAGILESTPEAFALWLTQTKSLKPGVNMPTFDMLPQDDIVALSHYLHGLK